MQEVALMPLRPLSHTLPICLGNTPRMFHHVASLSWLTLLIAPQSQIIAEMLDLMRRRTHTSSSDNWAILGTILLQRLPVLCEGCRSYRPRTSYILLLTRSRAPVMMSRSNCYRPDQMWAPYRAFCKILPYHYLRTLYLRTIDLHCLSQMSPNQLVRHFFCLIVCSHVERPFLFFQSCSALSLMSPIACSLFISVALPFGQAVLAETLLSHPGTFPYLRLCWWRRHLRHLRHPLFLTRTRRFCYFSLITSHFGLSHFWFVKA